MPEGIDLAPRLAGFAPCDADAWQDGLDLLATIEGWKPVCLLGRGGAASAALVAAARAAALPVFQGAFWDCEGDLPPWYLAATATRRAARTAIYVCADGRALRAVESWCARGRIPAAAEAALLFYPPCCVAAHHRQAIGLENLLAAMTERAARGDVARMTHMVAHGAEPAPRTDGERAAWAELTAIRPAPFTSVNMCASCARSSDGPARRLSRRYRELALRAGYPPEGRA